MLKQFRLIPDPNLTWKLYCSDVDVVPAAQVCFNLADDLRNMKGKGGRLFAKRQAKSESWAVGGGVDGEEQGTAGEPEQDVGLLTSTAELRLSASRQESSAFGEQPSEPGTKCEAMPVNRLKQMVELPRAAMTPWEAAATYGIVDPAFQHLESSPVIRRDNSSGAGSGSGGRMKSWSGNPDAAAGTYCN